MAKLYTFRRYTTGIETVSVYSKNEEDALEFIESHPVYPEHHEDIDWEDWELVSVDWEEDD